MDNGKRRTARGESVFCLVFFLIFLFVYIQYVHPRTAQYFNHKKKYYTRRVRHTYVQKPKPILWCLELRDRKIIKHDFHSNKTTAAGRAVVSGVVVRPFRFGYSLVKKHPRLSIISIRKSDKRPDESSVTFFILHKPDKTVAERKFGFEAVPYWPI